jgi:hypothetical protein
LPLQEVKPVAHALPHTPAVQLATSPAAAGHALAQAPQFLGSLSRRTHAEPHKVRPAGQLGVQVPALHATAPPVGAAHRLPQDPQSSLSVFVSAHVPSQYVRPAEQPSPHVPLVHVARMPAALGVGHLNPHDPQLAMSRSSGKQPFGHWVQSFGVGLPPSGMTVESAPVSTVSTTGSLLASRARARKGTWRG